MPVKVAAVIFDMDLTLVDTSMLAQLRTDRQWSEVYKRISATAMYEGVPEMLARCRELRLRVGIVTTAPSTYCNKLLQHHRIAADATVCYHDVDRGRIKPAPDQMILCAKRLSVPEASCLTLGDDPRDILASHSAEMYSAAALWGAVDREQLLAAKPTYSCQTVQDFIDVLNGLNTL